MVENPGVPGSRLARVCGTPWRHPCGVVITTLADLDERLGVSKFFVRAPTHTHCVQVFSCIFACPSPILGLVRGVRARGA